MFVTNMFSFFTLRVWHPFQSPCSEFRHVFWYMVCYVKAAIPLGAKKCVHFYSRCFSKSWRFPYIFLSNIYPHVFVSSPHTCVYVNSLFKSWYELSFFRSRRMSTENCQRGICGVSRITEYSLRILTYTLSLK
jgi:hypothetical protein